MASWIVHLRLAENLLGLIPDRLAERSRRSLEPASFAVGNIAPDSGMPDEKWEKSNPAILPAQRRGNTGVV
jgi:hypothetical protein